MSQITVITARWVLPMREKTPGLLQDAGIALLNQRIIALDSREQLLARYPDATHQHFDQQLLMPGLVNAHTHSAMSLFRGMADDLPLMDWLTQHIWPAEQKWVCAEWVKLGTQLAIAEMLRSGTTCFADMYFYPEIVAKTVADLKLRACLHTPILEFPSAWAENADDYLAKAENLLNQYRGNAMIRIGLGPHAPYTVSDETFKKTLRLAEKFDARIQTHLHETAHEVNESLTQHQQRPITRLHQLGVLSERLQAVHMTCLNEADIQTIAKTKTCVVHCPESNLKLASGFCPTQQLLQANIVVGLGTDGAASNNDLSLFGEMKTAALLAKAVAQDATALPAYDALWMATRGGAQVLGLDDLIGSLEMGKQADFITVDLSSLNYQPIHNPISQLVYTDVGNAVSNTWVGGRCVMQDKKVKILDEKALLEEVKIWQAK